MQHTTVLRPTRRPSGMMGAGSILALLVVLAVLAALWLNTPPPAPIVTTSDIAPQFNRFYADEVAYVPNVSEYQNPALGEDYLPLPVGTVDGMVSAPALSRRSADEAAYVPNVAEYLDPTLGENYLPIAAPAALPLPRAIVGANRLFTDEAAYMPNVAEYLDPTLGADYLPIAAPAAPVARHTAPPTNRFFDDELAGATSQQIPTIETSVVVVEPTVPRFGPR